MPNDIAAIAYLIGKEIPHGIAATIAPDGSISATFDQLPLHFSFRFAGTFVSAEVRDAGNSYEMILETRLGTLPYSIESHNRRNDLLRVASTMRSSGLDAFVGVRQNICIRKSVEVAVGSSPNNLLTAAVSELLPLRGWIDLVSSLATT